MNPKTGAAICLFLVVLIFAMLIGYEVRLETNYRMRIQGTNYKEHYTNRYVQLDNCIEFESDNGQPVKLCGSYSITYLKL